MQTHGGAAAEAAILGTERVIRAKVRVDWNRDGQFDHELSNLDRFIDEIETDRSLEGSAPEEILLIEGASASELRMTLHGDVDGYPLVYVFSPYNKEGPLQGVQKVDAEIKYSLIVDTPLGSFEYPQFIGNLRTITPDRGASTVEITALDRAEKMRKSIQLPPFAISYEHIAYGEIDSQYVRSQWVIDHALRMCDIGVSDKRPTTRQELGLIGDALDGPLVFVTGNGSYLPSIGFLDNPNYASFPNVGNPMFNENAPAHPDADPSDPKPLALAGVGTPVESGVATSTTAGGGNYKGYLPYWVADVERLNPYAVHYFGLTFNLQDNPEPIGSIAKYLVFQIILGAGTYLNGYVQAGQFWMEKLFSDDGNLDVEVGPSVAIPTSGDHVDIFAMWDLTPGRSRYYARCGSNTNGGWQNVGTPIPRPAVWWQFFEDIKGRFTVGQAVSISNIYYGTSGDPSRPVDDFAQMWRTPTYLAKCDQGLNLFSYIPSSKRQEAWNLVKEVAGAEFGSVFWDEVGEFNFWNWGTMLAKRDEIVRTYSLDHVEGLKVSNTLDSVRNVFSLTTKQKRSSMGPVHAYSSSDISEFYIPPRTTKIYTVWVDDLVSPLTWYLTRYASMNNQQGLPKWPENDNVHGFIVQYLSGGAWSEFNQHGSPSVKASFTMDGHIQIKITNDTIYPMRMSQGWPGDGVQEGNDPAAKLEFNGTIIHSPTDLTFNHRNEDSIAKYGERVLELSGDWYQDGTWESGMLDLITPRTGEPVPTTDAITVAGDPRLQLADCIRVTDDNQGMGDMDLQVFGINRKFSREDGLVDTLTVEMVPPGDIAPPSTDPTDPEIGEWITRVNLCDNPALLNNRNGWYGGTMVAVTGMDRSTGYRVPGGTTVVAPKAPVSAGNAYRFSVQVDPSSRMTDVRATIDWYSNYGYLGSSSYASYVVDVITPGRVYTPLAVAPMGATSGLLTVTGHTGSIDVTAALYEQDGEFQASYFDGDTPGGRWDGAQGNSTSRITEEI